MEGCRDYGISASSALVHCSKTGISNMFQNNVILIMRGPVHQGAEQHPPDPEYLLNLLISEPDLKAPISFNGF